MMPFLCSRTLNFQLSTFNFQLSVKSKSFVFIKPEHNVHVLHGGAGRAFSEIVELGGEDDFVIKSEYPQGDFIRICV